MMILCPTGNRSRQGARILRLAGFDAWYLSKGMFSNEGGPK
jgi:rhodanese-related sulfurtransferase